MGGAGASASTIRRGVRARPLLFRRSAHSYRATLDSSLLSDPLAAGRQQASPRGRANAVVVVVVMCGSVGRSGAAGRGFCWNSQVIDALLLLD